MKGKVCSMVRLRLRILVLAWTVTALAGITAAAAAEFKEVVIPAGTVVRATLESAVASDMSKREDPVRAKLSRPLIVSGTTVVPAGAELMGTVIDAKESGKVKG